MFLSIYLSDYKISPQYLRSVYIGFLIWCMQVTLGTLPIWDLR